MATSLTIYANTGTSDVEVGTSGSEWTEIDTTNDELIITDGNDTVKDGESIPSSSQLNSAAIVLDETEQTFGTYLLADASAGIVKEINNMGSANKRYVLGFTFDGSTINEPTLELWDDTDYDSIDLTCLGAGTASSSWWRGITTTTALPGAGWTGSRLAGSSDGYYLYLNNENGALSTADTLYCQLKVVVPATQDDAGSETPVIAVKFATV